MQGLFFLAWKHARFHRLRTGLLLLSISLSLAIPLSVRWATGDLQQSLLARSQTVPLMQGGPGSTTDLVLAGLYFQTRSLPNITVADWETAGQDPLVQAIPLLLGQQVRQRPLVGTTLDYFRKKKLSLAEGTFPLQLGDCILGAELADSLGLKTGDRLLSDAQTFLNPAGQLPLKMRITGVLEKTRTVEDRVAFVDLKTCWLIAGIGHGHEEVAELQPDQILSNQPRSVTTGANVQEYLEVTPENQSRFHFHGDPATFPLSLLLIYPDDEKGAILWEGRQQSVDHLQLARPEAVVAELISLLVNVKTIVDFVALLLGSAALFLLILIVVMSLQLREEELETFQALGASRKIRLQLIALDLLLVLLVAVPLTGLLALLLRIISQPLLMNLIL